MLYESFLIKRTLLSALLSSYLLNFLTNFVSHYILMFLWISGRLIESKIILFDVLEAQEHPQSDYESTRSRR